MKNVPNHQPDRFIPQDTKIEDIQRFFQFGSAAGKKQGIFFTHLPGKQPTTYENPWFLQNMSRWRFPKMGGTPNHPNHPFIDGFSITSHPF